MCSALSWQKRVEEDFGNGLANTIRKCILCAFDPAPNLSNSEFLQAVFQNVVKPVEEFLSAWSTGAARIQTAIVNCLESP